MSMKDFVAAIAAEADTPCEKFACQFRAKCAAGPMACSAFRHYVRTGSVRNPCLDISHNVTQKTQPILRDHPLPSWAIFCDLDDENDLTPDKRAEKIELTVLEGISSRPELARVWG